MSLRLALASLASRAFVKPLLAYAQDPALNDRLLHAGARNLFRAPPFALYRDAALTPELSGLWVAARPGSHPVSTDRIVLYLHGGGFVGGSSRTHAAMAARLGWLSGLEYCLPDYRIAPDHPFPAAHDDVRAAWDALIVRGYRPEHIAIAGDSAGGNLALALMAELCAEGTPPSAVACLSPFTDFTFSSPSVAENARRDPMLPASRAPDVAGWYLSGHDATDPRVSPVNATFDRPPPPVLFHYAENEILRDDSRRMAERLRAAGGEVVERSWPSAPHVFQIFDGFVPEARESLEDVAGFLRGHLVQD